MNEELLSKLNELLAKYGVEEETAKSITDELKLEEKPENNEDGEEKKEVEEKVEEKVEDDAELQKEEGVVANPVEEEVPPTVIEEKEEKAEEVEDALPPVADSVSNQEVVEEQVEDALPQEVIPPVATQFDPNELLNKIDEQAKVIEGLQARLDSLNEALTNAGVIDNGNYVGEENQKPLNDIKRDETGFNDLLAELNRRSKGY